MPSAPRRLVTAHWGLLIVCAGFLLAGALVLDDYGISWDEPAQRAIGMAALDSLAGDGERAFERLARPTDRYYGPAFEAPLILVERALGLEGRDIWLSRHALTHLFFLAGGVFCYLLVLRIFGSQLLALAAMALFLLHPRLYAHSFFNSKDVPFAAMFMIALYLTHRAFRRETLGAFLLCGVGMGVLVNLRAMGLALVVAVLALWALDLLLARGAEDRKRVLLTGGAFALAATLTHYALLPVLWTDPGQLLKAIGTAASHPNEAENLFRGDWLYSPDGPPFEYIPVWIGITTPPVVLLLATVGVAGLFWRTARHPRDLWSATPLRFNVLLVLLVVVPIIAIFVGRSNIYDGWRQVYFLYAPLALLAILGTQWVVEFSGSQWMKSGLSALIVAGVAVIIVSMIKVHPHEHDYFNSLVDRNSQDLILQNYEIDYWNMLYKNVLDEILEDHPDQDIMFSDWMYFYHSAILPRSKSGRIMRAPMLFFTGFIPDSPGISREYISTIYNNTAITTNSLDVEDADDPASIIQDALSGEPVARSIFTLYLHDNMIVFSRENCSPEHIDIPFAFDVFPVDITVLSSLDKKRGHEGIHLVPGSEAIDDDGRCAWIVLLPPYPIASIFASQYTETGTIWSVRIGVTLPEVDPAVLASGPAAISTFDVYRDDAELIYVKDPCVEGDIGAVFGFNAYPLNPGDLPADRKRDRFNALTFRFWDHGVRVGNRCVAVVPLPDYPVAGVRTGQLDMTGWLWDVSFGVTPLEVDATVLAREPLARSVFDVYRDGDVLVYVRDGCTEEETGATFLLHVVPVDVADLPADRVQYGFDNRDFEFWWRGGVRDGRCVAVAALPDYPIASVVTGQYDETGQLWAVESALPE